MVAVGDRLCRLQMREAGHNQGRMGFSLFG